MAMTLHLHRLLDRLPWALAKHLVARVPAAQVAYWSILCERPLILLIPEDTYDAPELWAPFFEALRSTKTHFLCLIRGPVERDPSAFKSTIARYLAEHRARYPKHSFTFLANNGTQARLLEEVCLRALLVNQNALVDESVFRVQPEVVKRFDAVYNAQAAPVKRHGLARDVERLALITYIPGGAWDAYFDRVAAELSHGTWLNFPDGRPVWATFRKLQPPELSAVLNQARTGLCLSEAEGPMFASVEYLVCGLPVVTTPSIGGRDVFFSDDYVATVEATPRAVADGVKRMIARQLDPSYIRRQTLDKIAEHRRRLVAFIVETAAAENVCLDFERAMAGLFPGAIYKLRPLHHVLAVR